MMKVVKPMPMLSARITEPPKELERKSLASQTDIGLGPDSVRRQMGAALYADQDPKTVPPYDLYALLRTPCDPTSTQEQAYRDRIYNRGTAIRAFCITCADGQKAVKMCPKIQCPFWAFRMGGNPLSRRK